MTTKPRIGVIGFQMGANHAETMYNHNIAEFAAAADMNPDARQRVELLGGTFYTDYEQMLDHEALDGVIIALPHHLHAPVAEMAAARGCHLYIEKPLAHTTRDCRRIIDAAQRHGVRIMVGYQRRFSGPIQKARELVNNGALGRVVGVVSIEGGLKPDGYFAAEWKASRDKGGGPLFMNVCHTIDSIRYIAGDIVRVSSELSHSFRGYTVEDTASVSLQFRSGALGTLFVTDTAVRPAMPGLMFMGTEASLTVNPLQLQAYHWPYNPREQMALTTRTINIRSEAIDTSIAALERFCGVIEGTDDPLTSAEDALQTTAVIETIIAAGERHEVIEVPTARPAVT